MKALTNRQKEILEFIEVSILKNGYPPSIKEIADGVGLFSTSTVHGHLNSLSRKGYLRKNTRSPRTIKILNKDKSKNINHIEEIPIVKNLDDYNKLKTATNELELFSFPLKQSEKKYGFVFVVNNDNCHNQGVCKNDYVYIDMYKSFSKGDLVMVVEEDKLNLIIYSEEHSNIIGKLTNVLRIFA